MDKNWVEEGDTNMLSFEQKKSIFRSFHLLEKEISDGRVNFIYPDSKQRGTVLATQLHPSGNGYVLGKYMTIEVIKNNGYDVDPRGWIPIKNFSEDELIKVISEAINSMSGKRTMLIPNPTKGERKNPVSSEVFSSSLSESLVRSCLFNWLGYGNVNGQIWMIGMEEGGAEIWRSKTKTLEQSLKLRSTFKLSMDFQHVWEDLYHVPLEILKGPNVWRYAAAFILEFEGRESTPKHINDYIFKSKQLGREHANHFICEYMPLPKQLKESIEPYQSIWRSNRDYCKEVELERFDFFLQRFLYRWLAL